MKNLIIVLCLLCAGCNVFSQGKHDALVEKLPENQVKEVFIEKIKTEYLYKNLGWIQGGLIIGCVGGLMAAFLKVPQLGIPIFASCLIGLGLTTARIICPVWLVIIGLAAGVGIAGYAIWVNRRAFMEIIKGGETFKKLKPQSATAFRTAQMLQSTQTRKMVKKAQKKLNGK